MSKNTFLPEDLSGNIYIQASALQKCAKHLPPTFGGMIAMQSGRCPNMSKIVAVRRARIFIYDALLAVISRRPIGFKDCLLIWLVSCCFVQCVSISDYRIALKCAYFAENIPFKCPFLQKSPSLSDFSQEIFVYMQKKQYLCRRI
ncbi:MAG: hypothetical protein IJ882_05265 [Paludibacteraceae bacterium]|nr:hypothetical protein [Paludibacteraceae bacterium]